jgi:hypothetical protein
MTNRFIITSFLILLGQLLFAQQKINWAKYDCLPFKEDTTTGLVSRNYYNEVYHIPSVNLTQSDAIFEIRIIPAIALENLPITILQFYKDSTILEEYYRQPDTIVENFIKNYKDSSAEVYQKGITPLIEKSGGYSWKLNKKVFSENEAKKILIELTKRNLFTLDINEEIITAEKKLYANSKYSQLTQSGQVHKGPISYKKSLIIEIKYRNKYRVFRTGTVLFYYYDNNKQVRIVERIHIGSELSEYLMTKLVTQN